MNEILSSVQGKASNRNTESTSNQCSSNYRTISNLHFKCSGSPHAVTSEEGGYRALPKTPGILVVSSIPFLTCILSVLVSPICSDLRGGWLPGRPLPKTPGILAVSSIPFLTCILSVLVSPICSDLRGGWLPSSTKDTWYFGRKFNTISNLYFKCSGLPNLQ